MNDMIRQMITNRACEAKTREEDPRNDMSFDELRDLRWYKQLSTGGKALIEDLWEHYPKMGAWPGSFDGGASIEIKRNGAVFDIYHTGGRAPFVVDIWLGGWRCDRFYIPYDQLYWIDATRHLAHIIKLVESGVYAHERGAGNDA